MYWIAWFAKHLVIGTIISLTFVGAYVLLVSMRVAFKKNVADNNN